MSDIQTNTSESRTTDNRTIVYVWKIPVDRTFVVSISSIFRLAAAVLSLIAFICVTSGRSLICDDSYASSYNFFEFVSMSSFLTLVFSWMFYALTLTRRAFLRNIPWLLVDLVYGAYSIVMYFIANIVVAAQSCEKDNNKAGSAFGFMAMWFVVGNTIFQFRLLQIQRTVTNAEQHEDKSAEQNKERY